MATKSKRILTYIDKITPESIAPGANGGYAEVIQSLHTIPESLISEQTEGKKCNIKYIRYTIRMSHADTSIPYIGMLPVIVQTAGTFADTVNLTARTVAELLDAAIDDEFGFQKIGNMRISKVINTTINDASQEYLQKLETQFDVPQNVIQLLNKELSTEKLQSLYLGLVGICTSEVTFNLNVFFEVGYTLEAKGITIR